MDEAPTVLVVEDDPGFRLVVEMLLEADGYQVVKVADGREALAWLKEHTPSLAVLDVAMPHMTGLEVCARMKRVSRLADVPVVILTALQDRRTREGARDVEADALVLKPLEGKDFRSLVRRLLAGERQPI